ncbi:Acyltransferase 3 [Mesorhizobium plurifarium]|uniref:Acyltransferase 3 n=1 Tax=Mesorhizobium plurifarium TaxID=69974 RepID=A0A090DYD5_MESPL|nr:Acyltransferase 3 [Mesorhizobium plurifarium]
MVSFHCSREALPGGFVGVDLFFVLSGFLISSILLEEHARTGTIALGRFYLRRAMRLWPALVLMLAAYLVAAPLVFPQASAGRDALLAGLYLSDYSQAFWHLPYLPLLHTWSLSVEEHFYLLWPAAVLLLARFDRRAAIAMLVGVFLIVSLWRMIDLAIWRSFTTTFYRFDTRMSGLVLGSLIAFLPWRPKTAAANMFAAAGAAIIAWAMVSLDWGTASPLLAAGVAVDFGAGCTVLALAAGGSFLGRVLTFRPLAYIGMISYSIYLWHYPVVVAMRDTPSSPLSIRESIVVIVASFVLAATSYELLEKPLKAYRYRRYAVSAAE